MTAEVAKSSRRTKPRDKVPSRGSKPGERRGGRAPGTPNVVTKDLRESIRDLLDNAAPKMAGWLNAVAKENPGKALELALRAAEYAVPKLSRQDVNVGGHPLEGLLEAIEAGRRRAEQCIESNVDATPEVRRILADALPPSMIVVTGVPDASPSAAAEIVTRPKSVPVDQHAHWNTPVPPPLRLPGQAPSAASAEPPRLHTPHVTDADFDPYPH